MIAPATPCPVAPIEHSPFAGEVCHLEVNFGPCLRQVVYRLKADDLRKSIDSPLIPVGVGVTVLLLCLSGDELFDDQVAGSSFYSHSYLAHVA